MVVAPRRPLPSCLFSSRYPGVGVIPPLLMHGGPSSPLSSPSLSLGRPCAPQSNHQETFIICVFSLACGRVTKGRGRASLARRTPVKDGLRAGRRWRTPASTRPPGRRSSNCIISVVGGGGGGECVEASRSFADRTLRRLIGHPLSPGQWLRRVTGRSLVRFPPAPPSCECGGVPERDASSP